MNRLFLEQKEIIENELKKLEGTIYYGGNLFKIEDDVFRVVRDLTGEKRYNDEVKALMDGRADYLLDNIEFLTKQARSLLPQV